jgi:hypothetical protein
MSDENGILEEIGRFDQEYQAAERFSFLPGLEALRDGTHILEIVRAELGRTSKSREAIFKLILRTADGLHFERAYFFGTQEQVDRLGADLCQLGFDADRWSGKYNRRFSAELAKAIPQLSGIRFQAKKETKASNNPDKPFHNLYVTILISRPKGGNGTHATPPAAVTQVATKPQAEEVGGGGKSEEIPF